MDMDMLGRIKKFIIESIQSLFVWQKEDIGLVIYQEIHSAVSDLKMFVSQQMQIKERDMANMKQMVLSLNQDVENILRRLDAIQESIEQLKEHKAELPSPENHVQPVPPKHIITTYYAKMVDSMNPLGFMIDNLKNAEDGCAFKITLTDNLEGNYKIVDNKEIQREVLSAFNPLISESSIYDFVPQNPTEILVVQPGIVVKDNHVLRIIYKQEIKIS